MNEEIMPAGAHSKGLEWARRENLPVAARPARARARAAPHRTRAALFPCVL